MRAAARAASGPLDPARLDKLLGDCGDAAFVDGLIGRFRRMLPDRVVSVVAGLDQRDVDTALDRTLSLKVASATIGACELASLAARLEEELGHGALEAARAVAHLLAPAADRADGALADYAPAG